MPHDLHYDELRSQIKGLIDYVHQNNAIEPSVFEKYNVKRGLRNKNGTGVLVGMTRISDVNGYAIENGKKIPIKGQLRYRGIPIDDLINGFINEERYGYEEVAYLLLFGLLPTEKSLLHFNQLLSQRRNFPATFKEDVILKTPSRNVMNKLQSIILALYTYDDNPDDVSLDKLLAQAIDLIAKVPLMLAYAYQAKRHYFDNKSLILHQPLMEGGTAENILHLIRPDAHFTRQEAEILDLLLCVQADHGGGNNSAFATHVVSSSGTDTYSAICAAIGSLKGPRHGGANQRVHHMMEDIKGHVKDWKNEKELRAYIEKIIAGQAYDRSGLVYGMGHAVYTMTDPRAELLKEKARALAEKTNHVAEYELITDLARLTQDILRERKGEDYHICANVDLYTGIIYDMLGVDEDLFTPLFAAARMVGWCAHRMEQIMDSKIMRPAYVYVPNNNLTYLPIADRTGMTQA